MNLLGYTVLLSSIIVSVFVSAYIMSYIAQYLWSWVDDSKMIKRNVFVRYVNMKFKLSKWVYPVFNGSEFFGYAKDKKYEGKSVSGLDESKDYVYEWRFKSQNFNYVRLCLIFASIPFIILLMVTVPYIPITVFILILMMFIARFVRRINKKLKAHINDKKVHRKES